MRSEPVASAERVWVWRWLARAEQLEWNRASDGSMPEGNYKAHRDGLSHDGFVSVASDGDVDPLRPAARNQCHGGNAVGRDTDHSGAGGRSAGGSEGLRFDQISRSCSSVRQADCDWQGRQRISLHCRDKRIDNAHKAHFVTASGYEPGGSIGEYAARSANISRAEFRVPVMQELRRDFRRKCVVGRSSIGQDSEAGRRAAHRRGGVVCATGTEPNNAREQSYQRSSNGRWGSRLLLSTRRNQLTGFILRRPRLAPR